MAQLFRISLIGPKENLDLVRTTAIQGIAYTAVESGRCQSTTALLLGYSVELPRAGIQRAPAGSETLEDTPEAPCPHARHAAEP